MPGQTFEELKARLAIGSEFRTEAGQFRVTDIGSRTIVAIRVDRVTLSDGKVLDRAAAEREGWFNGPSFAVAEIVFDEDDYEAIEVA